MGKFFEGWRSAGPGSWLRRGAAFLAVLWLVAEGGVRAVGLLDFPLYDADARQGYIPRAQQSGAYLHQRAWRFNALHMSAPDFQPRAEVHDVLLVGDSIVLGGNPYRHEERLGPQLAARTGHAVWPIAAGSWSLLNEITWLEDHAEVVAQVDEVVFVLNSGDLAPASSWACEFTHPRSRPLSGVLYLFRKQVWPSPCGDGPPALKVPPSQWQTRLRALVDQAHWQGKPITVVLYPDLPESRDQALQQQRLEPMAAQLQQALGGRLRVVAVGRDARWSPRWYRDGIHPLPAGMAQLAAILAQPEPQALLATPDRRVDAGEGQGRHASGPLQKGPGMNFRPSSSTDATAL